MVRKPISEDVVVTVLTECRRRCCVCHVLEFDFRVKDGQIAHLDGDPSNNERDNLAFLCLNHHNEFDSRTSQSRGLRPREIKVYRADLLSFVARLDQQNPIVGQPKFVASEVRPRPDVPATIWNPVTLHKGEGPGEKKLADRKLSI